VTIQRRGSARRRGLVLAALLALLVMLRHAPAFAQAEAEEVLSGKAGPEESVPVDPHMLLPTNDVFTGDLDGMRRRNHIRILVPFSKTFYFIDKGGRQSGVTYELGKEFETWLAKREKVAVNAISIVFIPVTRDRLLSGLLDGTGDIAAGNLTITESRSQLVDFGVPLATGVREILVTAPDAPAIASLDDLGGKEIAARASSSYFEHLQALNEKRSADGKAPIILTKLDEDLEDEDLMEMVNTGLLPRVVVDEHKAKLWSSVYTKMKLRSDIVINEDGEVAWAIRKNSPLLKQVVDEFAKTHKLGTLFGNLLRKKYLGKKSPIKQATSEAEIKKFEELARIFQQYGKEYEFDALMLAAQGYQESRLDQSARSHRGAVGIMQVMPSTAADPAIGIDDVERDAGNNVHAGVKYLRLLVEKYLDDPGLDEKNRTLMAFAAYNAGPGNLRKFRKLASESGLDPNVWFGNVENAAAAIVGRETVDYVDHIYIYYIAYRLATEHAKQVSKAKEALPTTP